MSVSRIGIVSILTLLSASSALAISESESESAKQAEENTTQLLSLFSAQVANELPQLTAMKPPCPSCSGDVAKEMKSATANEPPPSVQCYVCQIEEVDEAEADKPMPWPSDQPGKKKNNLSLQAKNDNPFLVGKADDRAFTHALELDYQHQFKDDESLLVELSSELRTRKSAYSFHKPEAMEAPETGAMNLRIAENRRGTMPQNFLDVTRAKVTYKKGDPFFFTFSTGMEIRQSSVGKNGRLPFAAATQRFWHRVIGAYDYQYVDAKGQESEVHDENGSLILGPEVDRQKDIRDVSKISGLAGASAGLKKRFFRGRCELEAEVGGLISSDSGKVIGPNSYAFVRSNLEGTVIQRRDGSPRLKASVGSAVLYFPKSETQPNEKFGRTTEAKLVSLYRVGKNGNTIEPFVKGALPQGARTFRFIDRDEKGKNEPITSIGVGFSFGGKGKKRD